MKSADFSEPGKEPGGKSIDFSEPEKKSGRKRTDFDESGKEPGGKTESGPVIRILVAAHKRAYAPKNRLIRLVQAGSALAEERLPGMLHDDEGEHISERNRTYCELTVQYYAWKNLEADYYGFFHYRRYMSFAKEYPVTAGRKYSVRPYVEADSLRGDLSGYALEEAGIRAVVEKYDVLTVLPERMNVTVCQQYCQFHNGADLERMIRILKKRRPEFAAACDRYMNSRYIYFCNMYIMRREYFQAYMEWLFPLLEEFEAGEGFNSSDAKMMRITGYLAERLFGVYHTWLRQQGKARCCELHYVIFHTNIRQFRIWRNGPQIAVDMKKVNRLLPPGSMRRRAVRTLAGRAVMQFSKK